MISSPAGSRLIRSPIRPGPIQRVGCLYRKHKVCCRNVSTEDELELVRYNSATHRAIGLSHVRIRRKGVLKEVNYIIGVRISLLPGNRNVGRVGPEMRELPRIIRRQRYAEFAEYRQRIPSPHVRSEE